MCTFQEVIPIAVPDRCAEGHLPEIAPSSAPEESHTAILPFLAPAAAIITMSELIKATLSECRPHDNSTEFNLSTCQGIFIGSYQSFGNCHICSNQGELYLRFGPMSKHWHLSTEIKQYHH